MRIAGFDKERIHSKKLSDAAYAINAVEIRFLHAYRAIGDGRGREVELVEGLGRFVAGAVQTLPQSFSWMER